MKLAAGSAEVIERPANALGVEPEYFLEYRQWKVKQGVDEAMAAGLIDLEGIEVIPTGKRYRQTKARKRG